MTGEQHRRVLVVEDDNSVRRLLAAALHQRGLIADEARNGADAITLLAENRYAVVLLDLVMPGADGFAVLEAIGDDTAGPVVLVVSGADRSVLDRLDARRIHGIVKKPFDPQELATIVTACAEIRSRSLFETMAMAAISSAPIISLLKL
jgi:two-component system, OmpR family, phosphate regulon response regulator OmpR